ncbi:MAG: iron ABC transporter permease [Balneolales bacterium]|nr:iron ABC transporter permease [Balneolales bacterium]
MPAYPLFQYVFDWLKRYKKQSVTLFLLVLFLGFFGIISIGIGPVSIPPKTVVEILGARLGLVVSDDSLTQFSAIVNSIRLPRVILAMLVGATLSVSGAALQGLFRNPLADPTLIGVSSGAAFAAAIVIVLGAQISLFLPEILTSGLLPFAAFVGGLVATWLVYVISTKAGRTSVTTMLLSGIAINALSAAGIGYLIFSATDLQIRDFTFWTLGSMSGAVWDSVITTTPFLLVCIIGLPLLSKQMNILLLGEHEARHLGVNTQRIKKTVIVLAALGIGTSVAISGIIGFVGLVVPHLLRLIIGPDHRFLMPGSAILGALLLLSSDLFARMIVSPAELPIGIVTSTIGAPFFLWLLVRNRSLTNYL